jgi:Zn-dependent protease
MQPTLTGGLIWYFVFLYSTVFHEAAHAWAAKKLGDDTAYRGGQVSLDPIPHIMREPFGMVVLPIVSYLYNGWMMGFASAPYDPTWALRFPKRSALMAIAGPTANFILATASFVLIVIGSKAEKFTPFLEQQGTDVWALVGMVLFVMFMLNTVLMLFNLLPLPPLDGSSIPLFFLKDSNAEQYQQFIWQPHIAFMGMLVAFYGGGEVVWPIFGAIYRFMLGMVFT